MLEIVDKSLFKIMGFRSLENFIDVFSQRIGMVWCSFVTNVFPIGQQQLKAGGLQNVSSKTPFISVFLLVGGRHLVSVHLGINHPKRHHPLFSQSLLLNLQFLQAPLFQAFAIYIVFFVNAPLKIESIISITSFKSN